MNRMGIHLRLYVSMAVFLVSLLLAGFSITGTQVFWAVIGFALVGLFLFYTAVRDVRVFLKDIQTAVSDVASGNADGAIPHGEREDDVGGIARTLKKLQQSFSSARNQADELQARSSQAEARKKQLEDEISQFKALSTRSYALLSGAAGELGATSDDMTNIVKDAQIKTDTTAALSVKTADNVKLVADSAEQLSAATKEIAQRVTDSSKNARDAMEKILSGEQSAATLNKAATEIGAVVQQISEIAEQTNLLALNATIEAARAGDAGKGFAVVAAEVKSLSNSTAKATDSISGQILGMQTIAQQMIEIITMLKQTIVSSAEYATSISAAIEEQGRITSEIAHNMQLAAVNVSEISSNITQVKAITAKTSGATLEVQQAGNVLSGQAESLNRGIQEFLTKISS